LQELIFQSNITSKANPKMLDAMRSHINESLFIMDLIRWYYYNVTYYVSIMLVAGC